MCSVIPWPAAFLVRMAGRCFSTMLLVMAPYSHSDTLSPCLGAQSRSNAKLIASFSLGVTISLRPRFLFVLFAPVFFQCLYQVWAVSSGIGAKSGSWACFLLYSLAAFKPEPRCLAGRVAITSSQYFARVAFLPRSFVAAAASCSTAALAGTT